MARVMHVRKSQWGMSLYTDNCPRFAGFGLGLGPDPHEGLVASASRDRVDGLVELAKELGGEVQEWWKFRAASGAPGKGADGFSRWHVIRFLDGPGISGQNLLTKNGRLRTFATQEAAQKAADKANVGITAERNYGNQD